MKVSLKWLNEYVEVPSGVKALCDRLDLTGTGVEGVEVTGAAFDGVVVGHVLTCEVHPDSDHMHVVTVDVGAGEAAEPTQIVCGAPNVAAGIKVPVATVGAVLPGDFKIKKSKLRGVTSCGMCCSRRELGMGADHDGIWILPEDAPVGMPIAEYLGMTDTVLDLEITPNRPDCLSVTGLAREFGAMYRLPVADPLPEMAGKMAPVPASDVAGAPSAVKVTIDDAVRCPRYSARVICGCKVGPSPDWMVERLAAIGQRSINNVVDVTNYILFLFGQPLHAFDLDTLKDAEGCAHVLIRAAAEGEKFTTLDGEERVLSSDMTVIATPERGAVALAGVMGGLDTEVTEGTTSILLEAATFEAGRTSRTSRNLGLISESSLRYERRVDDHGIDVRSAAAAALIAEVAGGTVVDISGDGAGLVDEWPLPSQVASLPFRIPRFIAMMGADIPQDFIEDTLRRLGCTVAAGDGADTLAVTAPTFRPDLEREIDLYEEVLRLWGMDRIPPTLPASPDRVGLRTEEERTVAKINHTLRACGLNETMTYSFAEPGDVDRLRMPAEGLGLPVELLNPLNADQSVMRQSIVPGLLRSVAHNLSHGVRNIQLYEIGTVFAAAEGRKKPKERQKVAGVLAGAMHEAGWNRTEMPFDFFDGKGVLESLARELALPKLRFTALSADEAGHLQPGRAASMMAAGAVIGWVGEIHPLAARAFEVEVPAVAFELDVDALVKAACLARPYEDVPTFPAVAIDQAFVVDEAVTHEKMCQVMSSAGGKLLAEVRLFDVYRDEQRVGAGKKSMAYALTYRAPDRTLTGEEVEKAHDRLVKKVCTTTAAEVRG